MRAIPLVASYVFKCDFFMERISNFFETFISSYFGKLLGIPSLMKSRNSSEYDVDTGSWVYDRDS